MLSNSTPAVSDTGVHTVRQAYDRAAICARGVKDAKLNFPLSNYTAELESLRDTPLDQLAATLRSALWPFLVQSVRFVVWLLHEHRHACCTALAPFPAETIAPHHACAYCCALICPCKTPPSIPAGSLSTVRTTTHNAHAQCMLYAISSDVAGGLKSGCRRRHHVSTACASTSAPRSGRCIPPDIAWRARLLRLRLQSSILAVGSSA